MMTMEEHEGVESVMVVVSRLWLMGKKEGGNVRWIHKILADGPQNDDTLLFQANGGQIPIDRDPGCGPRSFDKGNAAYELKRPATQQKQQSQQHQQETQPEEQEEQEEQQEQQEQQQQQ